MPFITPFIVLGALAGLIPVAIHFFFRSRYRTVPWAAMKFLLTSVEQTSRRVKFQEYLLLLTRIAVLVFLAVALARPINLSAFGFFYLLGVVALTIFALTWILSPLWQWTSSKAANMMVWGASQPVLLVLAGLAWLPLFFGGMTSAATAARGEGDAVDAVFVIDTSYSMGAIDKDGQTRLKLAQAEALRMIDELPPHSTVQIVTCAGKGKTLLGPRSPADLATARRLIDELDIVHLATDLHPGVYEAKEVLARGQATNKELYLFSDMQKMGWEQQSGELKTALTDIKEKAIVHLVRCGTRIPKNVAIIDIAPQAGIPRPGTRVGFTVQLRNAGPDPVEKLTVSLAIDNDEKNAEPVNIGKLNPGEIHAVTIDVKLDKPGLHILTARVRPDDLEADNRFDQVIQVRDQVNILVVDGHYDEQYPEKASSFFLMHSLMPVQESDRASYKYRPRMVPARQATPEMLKGQDICILVNCAAERRAGWVADALPESFLEALEPFVKKEGHGLIVFSGDNVQPEAYNKVLGKKLGLLPLPLKQVVKATGNAPFFVDRSTFGAGPTAYRNFKEDNYFMSFDLVGVWQHVDLDDSGVAKPAAKEKKDDADDKKDDAPAARAEDNPVTVIARLDSDRPFAVSKKVDAGEVIFVSTAVNYEGRDPKTNLPLWTNFHNLGLKLLPPLLPFLDVSVSHLMAGQRQTYNLVAGRTLNWYPTEKFDYVYSLVHPDGKTTRLGLPEKEKDKRYLVTAADLPRAGIYRMVVMPRGTEGADSIDAAEALKHGTPIAVIPDLTESADLSSLSDADIDARLGFTPIHITAGEEQGVSAATERDKREWTVWALMAVLGLVLFEVAFAWWCGKGW